MFNDYWMLDQGLLARDQKGDLRDLIARRHADRATITVTPQDSLLIAYQRMKLYEVSQLPVLDGGKVAGIIDESDLLLAVYGHAGRYRDPVSSAMTGKVEVDPGIGTAIPPGRHLPPRLRGSGDGRQRIPGPGHPHRPVEPSASQHRLRSFMKKQNRRGFATRSIHAGQSPDPTTGAVMVPIYATSTYVQSSPGVHKGYDYARSQNPTRMAYERCVADLESGSAGFAFASGMAASATALELLDAGSHVVAMDDLYGGSRRLFSRVRQRSAGHHFTFVDLTDLGALEAAIKPETKLIWVETPTNPLLKLVDLAGVSAIARKRGILTVCDNTFASPWCQRPLEHGFDIVMHSATKYLNGHSDIVGGMLVVGENADLAERLAFLQNAIGVHRRAFRQFSRHARSEDPGAAHGAALPERDGGRPLSLDPSEGGQGHLSRVAFPSPARAGEAPDGCLRRHGHHGPEGQLEDAKRFLERCEIFSLAESLGGVESLIEHPGIMTHASLPAEVRSQLGIGDGLIRMSVGVEDEADLLAELGAALG